MGKKGNRVNKHESVTCLMNVFADWNYIDEGRALMNAYFDMHVHSTFSIDGVSTMEDYCLVAEKSGIIVAAGAVVKNNVPPKCLVAGIPARIIRENVEWSM